MTPAKYNLSGTRKFATLPHIERPRTETSTSQGTKSLRLPHETNPCRLSNPTTPANFLATLACHAFYNTSKSLGLHQDPGPLKNQISKSPSRHSLAQILRSSTSKSAPRLPVFHDFDFQTALAPCLARISATSWAAVFQSYLSEPAQPQNYGKTQHFAQFLPAKTGSRHISVLYHICAVTSLSMYVGS